MALYEMDVIETRTVKVRYTIEAESQEEAENFAVIGDTYTEEENTNSTEVINRVIYSSPVLVHE